MPMGSGDGCRHTAYHMAIHVFSLDTDPAGRRSTEPGPVLDAVVRHANRIAAKVMLIAGPLFWLALIAGFLVAIRSKPF